MIDHIINTLFMFGGGMMWITFMNTLYNSPEMTDAQYGFMCICWTWVWIWICWRFVL